MLSVPTQAERQGVDTTAFPGDTLFVPVNPQVAPILAGYPLPNDPGGPSARALMPRPPRSQPDTNQFSVRIDHRISDQAQLFARFNLNNVDRAPDQPEPDGDRSELCHPFF